MRFLVYYESKQRLITDWIPFWLREVNFERMG